MAQTLDKMVFKYFPTNTDVWIMPVVKEDGMEYY